LGMCAMTGYRLLAQTSGGTLGAPFTRQILEPALPESPFDLRFFSTAVKVGADGRIVRDVNAPGPSRLVGAEAAGVRAGLPRFTKILFANAYDNGTPSEGDRIDPNNPIVKSGSQHWPFVKQPMRSWPNALAVTPDGAKVYVTLPGREGYPDWRLAVINAPGRRVIRWIDLRPAVVVANEYANFASVVDTGNDAVIGEFKTGFYGEDLIFNANGTRLYLTDRFKDEVHAFAITAGPIFTELAEIPTGTNVLDR